MKHLHFAAVYGGWSEFEDAQREILGPGGLPDQLHDRLSKRWSAAIEGWTSVKSYRTVRAQWRTNGTTSDEIAQWIRGSQAAPASLNTQAVQLAIVLTHWPDNPLEDDDIAEIAATVGDAAISAANQLPAVAPPHRTRSQLMHAVRAVCAASECVSGANRRRLDNIRDAIGSALNAFGSSESNARHDSLASTIMLRTATNDDGSERLDARILQFAEMIADDTSELSREDQRRAIAKYLGATGRFYEARKFAEGLSKVCRMQATLGILEDEAQRICPTEPERLRCRRKIRLLLNNELVPRI